MSGIIVVVEERIKIGKQSWLAADSPEGRYSTIFEDDGETGYFYAWDEEKDDNHICDAMHIYNVKSVVDKDLPSEVKIGWSVDGLKSALLLNDYVHAVFDFSAQRGYCRTNFPPPDHSWRKISHEWKDEALELFK